MERRKDNKRNNMQVKRLILKKMKEKRKNTEVKKERINGRKSVRNGRKT